MIDGEVFTSHKFDGCHPDVFTKINRNGNFPANIIALLKNYSG
jgi:amino acid transporter